MAGDHAAVAQEMSIGARIGGTSTVVTLVSVAHAFSHAYGALIPLIVPCFLTDLQLTYTQLGLILSLSNLVWSPLQLGFGDLLDGYGFAAAFAAMAVFQVLADWCSYPCACARRSVPSPVIRNPATSLSDGGARPHGQVVDGHYRP
jgi:hypothetical protein